MRRRIRGQPPNRYANASGRDSRCLSGVEHQRDRARFYNMPPVPWGDLPVGAAITEPVEKQGEIDKTNPDEATKSALDELRRWERFALKRRTTGRKFEVRA